MTPNSPLRRYLKAVPGLAPAYRAARFGWRWLCCPRPNRRRQQRVAQVWSETLAPTAGAEASRARGWLAWAPVLRRYVFPQLGGLDWYHFVKTHAAGLPPERGLSLCCGDGSTERLFHGCGVCRDWEGVDISPEAIAACRQAAHEAGLSAALHYRVTDVEHLRLPRARYDLVVGWMGLHHLRSLPRVFHQVKRALRSEGIFVVNEYVGPVRFQMPARQVELINECLAMLPRELRRTGSGDTVEKFVRAPAEEVAAHDPSEAVSSDQILARLEREFAVKVRIDYGGAILQWALQEIMPNLHPDDADHMAWLDRMCEFERRAMARGDVGSDFTYVIAEKRRKVGD